MNEALRTEKGYQGELSELYGKMYEDRERIKFLYNSWIKILGDISGKNVLDVGSGTGNSSRVLAALGARVTAVDASLESTLAARAFNRTNPQEIAYLDPQPLEELGRIGEEKFDLVTACLVLHYAKNYKTLCEMLTAVKQNLKPGGRLVALNANPDNPVEPGPGYPFTVEQTWINPEQAFEDFAEFKVQLYTSEGEPIPPFINRHISRTTWKKAFNEVWGNQALITWHKTAPHEQQGLAVLEYVNN
jgi:SAM-dependent methyltransferase